MTPCSLSSLHGLGDHTGVRLAERDTRSDVIMKSQSDPISIPCAPTSVVDGRRVGGLAEIAQQGVSNVPQPLPCREIAARCAWMRQARMATASSATARRLCAVSSGSRRINRRHSRLAMTPRRRRADATTTACAVQRPCASRAGSPPMSIYTDLAVCCGRKAITPECRHREHQAVHANIDQHAEIRASPARRSLFAGATRRSPRLIRASRLAANRRETWSPRSSAH